MPRRFRPFVLAASLPLLAIAIAHAESLPPVTATTTLHVWPGDAPNAPANPPAETDDGHGRAGNVTVPTLTVYLPDRSIATGTAIIICPGGGYSHVGMEHHAHQVANYFVPHGIAVIGLKYRTKLPSSNVVADAADLVERFSCRPDFICPLCLWPSNNKIGDFPLSKDSPPTFMCIAKDDKIAWFAPTVEARLKELGVPVSLQTYDTGGHEAFTFGHAGKGQKWPERFLPWLKSIGMSP